MSLYRPNPSQVELQLTAHNIDGTPKLSLVTATVRVYHMNGVSEIEDLAPTALSQVGSTNTWRYNWAPASLPVDHYYAEYHLVDNDGADFVDFDDLTVMDIAEGVELDSVQTDVAFVKKIEKNRKRIFNNQLIIYEDDGVTEWLKWDLFDVNGIPTNGVKVYDTVPV
jgi:hypothetical protein